MALQQNDDGQPIYERLLQELEVTYRIADRDIEQIPTKGPVIVVANHPFGVLDGAVLATILKKIRPDIRFLANRVLDAIPEIRDLLIPVDVFGESNKAQANAGGLRTAMEFVKNGGCLAVFPAGEVSHFQLRKRVVADGVWT